MQMERSTTSLATKALLVLLILVVLASVLVFFLPNGGDNVADAAVLKQGSTGSTVKTMQTKLINWGYLSGKAD